MNRASSLATVGLVTALAVSLGAQQAKTAAPKQAGAPKAALVWSAAPAIFPAGAKMAVASGDPSKAGMFVIQLQMPDGYKVAPHSHPTDEIVRVISGTFLVGMGDKLDVTKTKSMAAGDSGTVAAKMHHYAIAKGATVVSVQAMGPFAMTYVNAADDPSKKK